MIRNSTIFLSRCFHIFFSNSSLWKYILAFLLFKSCSVRKKGAKELLLFAKMMTFKRGKIELFAKAKWSVCGQVPKTWEQRLRFSFILGYWKFTAKSSHFLPFDLAVAAIRLKLVIFRICFLSAFFAYNTSNVLESLMASSFTNSLKLEINTVSCFFGIWRLSALCTWDETFLLLWFEMSPEIYDFPLPLIVHEAKICTITLTQK